jgi:hypothetical protein
VLYAGPEGRRLTTKAPPRRVILGIRTDLFEYGLQLGLPKSGPPHGSSMFPFDAHVKEESIGFIGEASRPLLMLDRKGPSASVRDESELPVHARRTDATLA